MACFEVLIAADQASQLLLPSHDLLTTTAVEHLLDLSCLPTALALTCGVTVLLQSGSRHKHQLPTSPHQPSVQETAAYLEGLFAASYEAQPLVDVDHCYQVRARQLHDVLVCCTYYSALAHGAARSWRLMTLQRSSCVNLA